jgi:uncharacterized membrane protein (DUF2068 family)
MGLAGDVWAVTKLALAKRPWWMNLLWGFCLYMTFIYLPFDVFIKPVEEDQEVWFGLMLHGWAAKAGALAHWFVYGAGAYGFWRMKRWMWPWAAVYVAQVALAMAVWPLLYGPGVLAGAIAGAIFLVPTIALWRAKDAFRGADAG